MTIAKLAKSWHRHATYIAILSYSLLFSCFPKSPSASVLADNILYPLISTQFQQTFAVYTQNMHNTDLSFSPRKNVNIQGNTIWPAGGFSATIDPPPPLHPQKPTNGQFLLTIIRFCSSVQWFYFVFAAELGEREKVDTSIVRSSFFLPFLCFFSKKHWNSVERKTRGASHGPACIERREKNALFQLVYLTGFESFSNLF